jgi:hypothetical protein
VWRYSTAPTTGSLPTVFASASSALRLLEKHAAG